MEEKKQGLNTNSNTYIIIYSAILVVIVAFLLAFIYSALLWTRRSRYWPHSTSATSTTMRQRHFTTMLLLQT